MRNLHDVLIIGGGPAGLTAGIWLGRYLHSVVLVDSGDPRNWETRGVNGFLGQREIRPPELREHGRAECRQYGVRLVDAIVDHVVPVSDEHFTAVTRDGAEHHGRRLLLATGLRDIWPAVPGLQHVYGEAAHVCPDCDGYEARGRKVVVLGHGRKAVGMALNLTTWTRDIIICTNGHDPEMDLPEYCEKLDALNIPVLVEPIEQVCAEGSRITCLKLRNGMQLDAEKIFFAIGQYPADAYTTELRLQLGCDCDDDGQVLVDEHHHTSVRNVFAAGDIVPGPQLAIVAAAEGAIAALAIHKSLVPAERKLEPPSPAARATR